MLDRKPRGKILGCKKEKLFHVVENISKNIYHNYFRDCTELRYNFFPYFKLVRNYGLSLPFLSDKERAYNMNVLVNGSVVFNLR